MTSPSASMPSAPSVTVAPPQWVLLLGFSGLIPFVALSLASWMTDGRVQAQVLFATLAYGATIVSFLGAIHWGLLMRDASMATPILWVWGVLPSLLAWVALLSGAPAGLWILAGSLWACFAVDRARYPRHGVKGWLGMRLALTTIASVSCMAAALCPVR